jgi:hypothetical protein
MVLFEETWSLIFSKFDSNLVLSHKSYHDIFGDWIFDVLHYIWVLQQPHTSNLSMIAL